MKAIIFIAEKAHISLYDDTVTVCAKKNGDRDFEELYVAMGIIWQGLVDDQLGYSRFVGNEEPSHALYHQGDFSEKYWHYHLKFEQSINEDKFKQIINFFNEYSVISKQELEDFSAAFSAAKDLEKPKDKADFHTTNNFRFHQANSGKELTPSESAFENLTL